MGSLLGIAISGDILRGAIQGAVSGVLVALFVRSAGRALSAIEVRRLPFAASLGTTALVNGIAISAALAAASLPWALSEGLASGRVYLLIFAAASITSILFTVWFALDRLLGGEVLVGLVTGRYHRPRREERVFLFADLADSTRLAEQLGELAFHSFLNRIFTALSDPVQEHGGAIHEYVGDEVVVTWPVERGVRGGACTNCALAMLETLRSETADFNRDFAAVPRLRIAIHCGVVVAGEVGDLRREIAFSGETVNTTARIEAYAKEMDRELVISADVLHRAGVPVQVSTEALGTHSIKGRNQPVELFAITPVEGVKR